MKLVYLHVVGEGAEIIDLPSEEFLVRAEIIGFGRVLEVLVVEAADFPFVYVLDVVVVSIKSFVASVASSGVVHEVSRGGSSEVGSLGDDVGSSLTSNV